MDVSYSHLPRWRGFNLPGKGPFNRNAPFRERENDFQWIADWGFNFVRLMLDYRSWVERDDWTKFREDGLKEIDDGVDLGRRYGLHVSLNFGHAPGYVVSGRPRPHDPANLFENDETLDVCVKHWAHLARRYKGIPNEELSFELVNEPAAISVESYVHVVKRLVEAIRGEDPDRLIIADGLRFARDPVFELVDLKIAQATHCYVPADLTHYRAYWVGKGDPVWEPTWPLIGFDLIWDKDKLRLETIKPWKELEAKGIGVHVNEWGVHNQTPHQVALMWMRDCLELWKEAGWGWAHLSIRGSFGILDSGRSDVPYERWHGHALDRAMLELLQSY